MVVVISFACNIVITYVIIKYLIMLEYFIRLLKGHKMLMNVALCRTFLISAALITVGDRLMSSVLDLFKMIAII